jgi:hypothetical protein
MSNLVICHVIKCFAASKLVLNLDKTNKCIMINSPHSALCIGYKENCIVDMVSTEFLNLQIDNHLRWKYHIQQMTSKLSGACYMVRSVVHIGNLFCVRSFNCEHGVIFWSNSSDSGKLSTLQK